VEEEPQDSQLAVALSSEGTGGVATRDPPNLHQNVAGGSQWFPLGGNDATEGAASVFGPSIRAENQLDVRVLEKYQDVWNGYLAKSVVADK
jgi:hypothetical protein